MLIKKRVSDAVNKAESDQIAGWIILTLLCENITRSTGNPVTSIATYFPPYTSFTFLKYIYVIKESLMAVHHY
jgi:hypothetical protein